MSGFNKIAYFTCLRGVKLPDGAARVLVALYTYADANGMNARPGADRLATDCCMGESTVRRHLKALVSKGFIHEDRRGGRSGDGSPRASTFRLTNPSTAHFGAVDTDCQPLTSERLTDSQPLTSEPQPLTSDASTAQNWIGTKSRTSQLPPSQEPPTPVAYETSPGVPVRTDHRLTPIDRFQETNGTGRSAKADQLANAYSNSLPVPIEYGERARIAVQIDRCLQSGIEPMAIKAGLDAWNASDRIAPSQIPGFVNKANNRRATNGHVPTSKMRDLAELARQVRAEEQAALNTPPKELM